MCISFDFAHIKICDGVYLNGIFNTVKGLVIYVPLSTILHGAYVFNMYIHAY